MVEFATATPYLLGIWLPTFHASNNEAFINFMALALSGRRIA